MHFEDNVANDLWINYFIRLLELFIEKRLDCKMKFYRKRNASRLKGSWIRARV